jgi:hypothetical protein
MSCSYWPTQTLNHYPVGDPGLAHVQKNPKERCGGYINNVTIQIQQKCSLSCNSKPWEKPSQSVFPWVPGL